MTDPISPEDLDEVRALVARVEELEGALRESRQMIVDWSAYAPEYFRDKHNLVMDLTRIDRTLEGTE